MTFVYHSKKGLSFDEGLQEIKDYMQRYHPAGYGTEVIKFYMSSDGWTLEMRRYTSCD